MTTSQVQTAIRVRPLTSKELASGGSHILTTTSNTVSLSNRKFTYDSVYEDISQEALYADAAPPLLQAFLSGFNATVLAYGQTGSGKTYSMGSEAHASMYEGEISENDGLLPRFLWDMFASLEERKQLANSVDVEQGEKLSDYSVDVSFLEVYGEDIYDLLDQDRHSLPIREDTNGQVIVVGLRSSKVVSNLEAIEVLNTGTMNRTTASTLMNHTSSRSHAVFTVNLRQVTLSGEDEVVTTSRFTFVDLAGSERMKKTGAQGERAREGIRINKGLLALGNVINALADEERLSKGEKIHVPYRQSKLTRLLQDALGGNSKTLFLACVSPSDTNASETLSTLQYAHRARNIKNTPTKNVDGAIVELQNLRILTDILKCELIKKSFGTAVNCNNMEPNAIGEIDNDLLQQADALAYLTAIDQKVAQVTGCNGAVSVLPVSVPAKTKTGTYTLHSTSSSDQSNVPTHNNRNAPSATVGSSCNEDNISTLIVDVDPDEDMKILDELLELQHRDNQFSKEQQSGQEQLDTMEGEIETQEERLKKLRESLLMYHNMKDKYEQLMCEVHSLEAEKKELADELEKVPAKGCSKAIQLKLQRVEESLARARSETRKHQQKLRLAEQDSQKCKVMERKIQELKHAKVQLMKKQKEDASKHREFTSQKTREINALKRKEKTSNNTISKIQGENQQFRSKLERSRATNEKLSEKLKQTESQLMRLLTERKNNISRTSSCRSRAHATDLPAFEGVEKFAATSSEEVNSIKFLLQKSVNDRVNLMQQLKAYEAKVVEHGELLQSMASEIKMMNRQDLGIKSDDSMKEYEANIYEYQLKLELVENDLEQLRAKYPTVEEYYFEEDQTKKQLQETLPTLKIISKIECATLRTLLFEVFELHVNTEYQRRYLKEQLLRKESTIHSFEKELHVQQAKVETLSKSLDNHRNRSDEPITDEVNELKTANSMLNESQRELAVLSSKLEEVREALTASQNENAQLMDRLALSHAKQNLTQSNDETSRLLTELQEIWADVGLSMDEREAVRNRLKNCVEEACSSMVAKASQLRVEKKQQMDISKARFQNMHSLLGTYETFLTIAHKIDSNASIDGKIRSLNHCINEISEEYHLAKTRYQTLFDQTKTLTSELDLDKNTFTSKNLQLIMQCGRRLSNSISPPSSEPLLSNAFLDACEKDVKRLRMIKSERLLSTIQSTNEFRSISKEMDVNAMELSAMALYLIRRRSNVAWWNDSTFSQVQIVLSKQGSEQLVNDMFANHLRLVLETVRRIAHSRRLLSDALKHIIDETRDTIISTADFDVKDLYQSLQDTLSRLPPLSNQYVKGCIDQMQMFATAAETVSQTEVEMLTVLWEGLNVTSSERGRFWSTIEFSVSKIQSQITSPFDHILDERNEDWVLKAATEATKVQRELGVKVFKLKSIHTEVERLKTKQYAKNSIMSLNGELKALSTKMRDFEEKADNKHKLTNKRINSASLLEEERFRKQMQEQFATKLKVLRKMIQEWEDSEGAILDSDMLSEVVQDMLANSHRLDAWMNERTRFMHLRTTHTKHKTGKVTENTPSSARPSSRQGQTSTPRTAAVGSSSLKPRLTNKSTIKSKPSSSRSYNSTEAQNSKTPLSRTAHNTQEVSQRKDDGNPPKKKSPTIDIPQVLLPNPFGDLLADTPVHKENKS